MIYGISGTTIADTIYAIDISVGQYLKPWLEHFLEEWSLVVIRELQSYKLRIG